MRFTFEVTVEIERQQGKIAGRDEMEEQIKTEIEDVNPGSLEGDNGGEYEVTQWDVEVKEQKPKPRTKKETPA